MLAQYLNYTAGTTKASKISETVRSKKLKTHCKKKKDIGLKRKYQKETDHLNINNEKRAGE